MSVADYERLSSHSALKGSTFVWRIPRSVHKYSHYLLCQGFVRQNTAQYIIDPLIRLFARYYHPDPFTHDDIQNAHNLQCFASPIFTIQNLQWYLELHPNGSNTDNEGNVILYLCLAMIPPEIDKLSAAFTLSLVETQTNFTRIKSFSSSSWYIGWRRYKVSFESLRAVSQLTFRVSLHIVSVVPSSARGSVLTADILKDVLSGKRRGSLLRDTLSLNNASSTRLSLNSDHRPQSNNDIHDRHDIDMVSTQRRRATYRWCICDDVMIDRIHNAQPSEHFNGRMMTMGPFQWFLQFIPKQKNEDSPWFGLRIWFSPQAVRQCFCRITMEFHELRISRSTYHQFDDQNKVFLWSMRLDEEQIVKYRSLTTYTIIADVAVIDISLNPNQCLPGSFISSSSKFELYRFRPFKMDHLRSFEYEWKMTDRDTLNSIATASTVCSFTSPLFEALGLRWYLSLWPNGSRESREGTVNVFLLMASFPNETVRVPLRFELEWKESGKTCIEHQEMKMDHCCGGETIWPLSTADLIALNSMTIRVKVSIADIIGRETIHSMAFEEEEKEENIMNEEGEDTASSRLLSCSAPKDVLVPRASFEWLIDEEEMHSMKAMIGNQQFESVQSLQFAMHGMEWDLLCYPYGDSAATKDYVVIKIRLSAIPTTTTTAIINVRYNLSVREAKTRFAGEGTFRDGHLLSSWGGKRISSRRVTDLQRMTIELEMELIDVYDEGHRITNAFLPHDFHHRLRGEMTDGMMEVARLEVDEMNHWIQELKSINDAQRERRDKKEIPQNDGDDGGCSHRNDDDAHFEEEQESDLQIWCRDELGMPSLFLKFKEFGICDLEMLSFLGPHDVNEIVGNDGDEGMTTKILLEIAALFVATTSGGSGWK